MNQMTAKPDAKAFRQLTTKIATSLLVDWVGKDRANEAIGRVASALAASAAASRDPQAFYNCTPQSVAQVVAVSALTGIMPSTGATALAYAIPKAPRKNEQPQLQYHISHRGLNALARRSGQMMIAVPVSNSDVIDVDEIGQAVIKQRDIDNPPTTFDELRGVVVVVKELSTNQVTFSGWVPKKLIEKRRDMSDAWKYDKSKGTAYSPWSNWPIEQAQKTAMKYCCGRGWCVIDDTESVRALSVDGDSDVIEGSATVVNQQSRGIESLSEKLPSVEGQPEETNNDVQGDDVDLNAYIAEIKTMNDEDAINDYLILVEKEMDDSGAENKTATLKALRVAADERLGELKQ